MPVVGRRDFKKFKWSGVYRRAGSCRTSRSFCLTVESGRNREKNLFCLKLVEIDWGFSRLSEKVGCGSSWTVEPRRIPHILWRRGGPPPGEKSVRFHVGAIDTRPQMPNYAQNSNLTWRGRCRGLGAINNRSFVLAQSCLWRRGSVNSWSQEPPTSINLV